VISFKLNGEDKRFHGKGNLSLLSYLREAEGILSVKDGCSGQGACGACLVEMDGKSTLSCLKPMEKVEGARIITIEGFPESLRRTLGQAFVREGAVQCGFCTPGFLSRTKILLENNPDPTREEIIKALNFNLCRCTGYVKIIEAIELAAKSLREDHVVELSKGSRVGVSKPKYNAFKRAIGKSPFVNDIQIEGLLYSALKFSDHARARIIQIDDSRAKKLPGVIKIFTGKDIPGDRITGLIKTDWPMMVVEGETTRYIGDVLAGVVAETEEIAREAVGLIDVEYEVLDPLTNMLDAEQSAIKVHEKGNLLSQCAFKRGAPLDTVFETSDYVVEGTFNTQRVEHGYLETEATVAIPVMEDGIKLYVQSQGVYDDQRQIARLLGIPEDKVEVNLVPSGGAFGGKEDLTTQGHAALFSFLLKKPIKLHLSRGESIRMHPKRHPLHMVYKLACDRTGKLTGLKARITGDTGAYASLGAEVLERSATHAGGAYYIPNVDVVSKAVYTNNIPSGAMRGFGVNQVTFAIESLVDELCKKGNFDRWQFRYDNVIVDGSQTTSGQVLEEGVGLRETLLAVKDEFYKAQFAGLACGIKNCGIGKTLDENEVKIEIKSGGHVVLHHGWTEMGQGVDTVVQQIFSEETGINNADMIDVMVCTSHSAKSGMTTASRATSLVGNAIIDASWALKKDLETKSLSELDGEIYRGRCGLDYTSDTDDMHGIITHFAFGYATHLVVLDDEGNVDTVYAAHDAGKVINPSLFEGQIQGAVAMGLGYALTEKLPMKNGNLETSRLSKLGILKAKDIPNIVVKTVEVKDPLGPYGAKGIGEIGSVPTAGAVANALYQFDKVRRFELPMKGKK
jgi:selenium-dependent xanthine dehydrogenase